MDGISSHVINLPERTDRRREMARQLQKAGIAASFFPAVRPPQPEGFPSIGAHGCFMSHLNVLKQGSEQNQHVLIIEDDLDFVDDFRARWDGILSDVESRPWSIFYPAHVIDGLAPGLTEVSPETGIMCTHFVMFHRDVVAAVVDGLERILHRPPGHPDGGPMHVDGAYSTLRAQNRSLRTFAYSPALGTQRSSRSDIADAGFYDRLPLIKLGAQLIRKLKRSLGL